MTAVLIDENIELKKNVRLLEDQLRQRMTNEEILSYILGFRGSSARYLSARLGVSEASIQEASGTALRELCDLARTKRIEPILS